MTNFNTFPFEQSDFDNIPTDEQIDQIFDNIDKRFAEKIQEAEMSEFSSYDEYLDAYEHHHAQVSDDSHHPEFDYDPCESVEDELPF